MTLNIILTTLYELISTVLFVQKEIELILVTTDVYVTMKRSTKSDKISLRITTNNSWVFQHNIQGKSKIHVEC